MATPHPASSETTTDRSSDNHAVRVLLVDDQMMIGEAVRRALASEPDIQFRYCGNSADALAAAMQFQPTVILQDLVMPGVDGLTLVRQYRAETLTKDIPIVVLSSKEDPLIKSEAFAADANDYLVKLPDKIELIARIRHHSKAHSNQIQRDAAYRALSESQQQLIAANADLLALNQKLEGAQSQLLQSEKMASVGQLAAGVAHEINNPIGFIGSNMASLNGYVKDIIRLVESYSQLEISAPGHDAQIASANKLKQSIRWDFLKEDILALLTESLDGIKRVAKIVKDLKDFSHVDNTEWQQVDIHQGLDSTLNVIGHELNQKADVFKVYAKLPLVECLPFQLNQVFLNVLMNAAQAIDGRGQITVRTERDGDNVQIQVSDTGKGIDSADFGRIFEPFFTTKPIGTGTGLGLSVCHSIIQKHGGTIGVTSEVGAGSIFTIRLPIKANRNVELGL